MKSSLEIAPQPLQELVEGQVDPTLEGSVSLELPLGDGTQPLVYDSYNERMKLYGVRPQDIAERAPTEVSEDLASKITVYAPPGDDRKWRDIGFQKEAVIQGFFEGSDAHLWAAYTNDERELSPREDAHRATVQLALSKPLVETPVLLPGFESDSAQPNDSSEIAALLDQTFEDYPTPIDQDIIAEQIANQDNFFRVVRDGDGEVAAVASAELDHLRMSAEMTDCATRPDQRGKGLMAFILRTLEHDIGVRYGIRDLYTIARADEVGMNCVFSKLGYDFHGRLINNCRMPNGWESMNVWCRNTRLAEV
jgi:beta-lysine N6-acetyltransferase